MLERLLQVFFGNLTPDETEANRSYYEIIAEEGEEYLDPWLDGYY